MPKVQRERVRWFGEDVITNIENALMKILLTGTEADMSALIASVEYRPQVGVEEGVANFVRWYKEYIGVRS